MRGGVCAFAGWRERRAGEGQRSDVVVSASVDTTDVAEGSDLDPAALAAKTPLHRGRRGCLAGR